MLCTLEQVQAIPGLGNVNVEFLNLLLIQADRAIKTYLKREIEICTYTHYFDGNNRPDIYLRCFPVIVDSTLAVYFDPLAFYGQAPSSATYTPFAPNTQLVLGTQFAIVTDNTPVGISPLGQSVVSNRGILRMLGGFGTFAGGFGFFGGFGYGSYGVYGNKLAGSRLPFWPFTYGGIKVIYNAGYETVPSDLQYACMMMVAYAVRVMPSGAPLSSESLGSYSYSIMNIALQTNPPELGSLARTLAPYREVSW